MSCKPRSADSRAGLRAAAANTDLAAAPALAERARRARGPPGGGSPGGGPSLPKVLWNRTLRQLSSLPLAIGELAVIAVLSSLGTIIEQGKPLEFYVQARVVVAARPTCLVQAWCHGQSSCLGPAHGKLNVGLAGLQNYPDGPDKVAGFVDWHLIQAAQLDRIYTAGYFLGMLGLLAASLAACTATRQWPAVRVARRRVHVSRAVLCQDARVHLFKNPGPINAWFCK